MALISISGKIGSGKDTVGSIIQVLTEFPHFSNEAVENWVNRLVPSPKWEIRKYADKLKDMTCLLIGCTREQLEDHEFKNTELDPEWWYYNIPGLGIRPRFFYGNDDDKICESRYLVIPTPRMLLQQMGTECGRQILHPSLWVNSLFTDYKLTPHNGVTRELTYPRWIITDMRFPNELKAVKDRNGISIRVERNNEDGSIYGWGNPNANHPSETALDNAKFDYTINNSGTMQDLIEKVKEILTKENII